MRTGQVKWFNNEKGYGFVTTRGEEEKDVFIHFSDIQMEGYKALQPKMSVVFDLQECDRGPRAYNLHLVSDQALGESASAAPRREQRLPIASSHPASEHAEAS